MCWDRFFLQIGVAVVVFAVVESGRLLNDKFIRQVEGFVFISVV